MSKIGAKIGMSIHQALASGKNLKNVKTAAQAAGENKIRVFYIVPRPSIVKKYPNGGKRIPNMNIPPITKENLSFDQSKISNLGKLKPNPNNLGTLLDFIS